MYGMSQIIIDITLRNECACDNKAADIQVKGIYSVTYFSKDFQMLLEVNIEHFCLDIVNIMTH